MILRSPPLPLPGFYFPMNDLFVPVCPHCRQEIAELITITGPVRIGRFRCSVCALQFDVVDTELTSSSNSPDKPPRKDMTATPDTDTSIFTEFPKIARLSRECIITEKIDGTNGQIYITEDGRMLVGSRTRWITPENDNHGFARWAHEHREELMTLGTGRHFGEWWGSGIQRGYGLPKGEKRWSLFNVSRWCLSGETPQRIPCADPRIEKYQEVLPACCGLVPVLYRGLFTTDACEEALRVLREAGSSASPGFMKPEGIVCFHVAANTGFKKTLERDEAPKSAA